MSSRRVIRGLTMPTPSPRPWKEGAALLKRRRSAIAARKNVDTQFRRMAARMQDIARGVTGADIAALLALDELPRVGAVYNDMPHAKGPGRVGIATKAGGHTRQYMSNCLQRLDDLGLVEGDVASRLLPSVALPSWANTHLYYLTPRGEAFIDELCVRFAESPS